MSEYQYYEFQAIDQPLDGAAQAALRSISSRARITATSFTNHYDWGDLRGDPREFLERWFDLHLYFADWGARRLMMRVPGRFLNHADVQPFLRAVDWAEVWTAGDYVIVDVCRDEVEPGDHEEDGSGWLGALAPLRADVLSGDLRLFYLLWLTAVQDDLVADDELEPLPGIGPLTAALEAFAAFFDIDRDLVEAAAETGARDLIVPKDSLREAFAAISDSEKTELLLRLIDGDSHVAAELKARIRKRHPAPSAPRRTVGTLRKRAQEVAELRERAKAEQREAERRRQAEEAETARRARLKILKRRGNDVWREIEAEIERRNASGYDKAAGLLFDLQALAAEEGGRADFRRRFALLRKRHEKKGKFIERLSSLGYDNDETEAHVS